MSYKERLREAKKEVASCKKLCEDLGQEAIETNRNFSIAQNKLKTLERKLEYLKNQETLTISDHGLVRYLERVLGVDIQQVKDNILTDYIKDLYYKNDCSDGEYPTDLDYKAVIKGGKIVTII